jgi:hypothetical protein
MHNVTTDSDPAVPARDLEVMPMAALEATERATVDSQITTAKRYPRSMERFKKGAIGMATLDEETAESCLYRRPVGMKDGVQQFAEGMSVRMAEIVGANYGNLRVGAVLVEQTDRLVRARGMAIDLENNFASSSEVVESTVDRNGKPFSERMRIVVAKAALAKARRDATFQVVPKALAKPVESAVRSLLLGDTPTLEKRRQIVVAWIGKLGIDPKRVYSALGIQGEADLNVDKLEQLTGLRTAIKDNEVSIDEAFPAPEVTTPVFKKPVTVSEATKEALASETKKVAESKTEKTKPEAPVGDKQSLIDVLESHILNAGKSEQDALVVAVAHGHAPVKRISELDVETLSKLITHFAPKKAEK